MNSSQMQIYDYRLLSFRYGGRPGLHSLLIRVILLLHTPSVSYFKPRFSSYRTLITVFRISY
nr:MAG TPA: hypothetical protein [Caudoviricetes sp.]